MTKSKIIALIAVISLAFATTAIDNAVAHGPKQPPHQIADLGELVLESGGVIKNLRMSYVTHGKLNQAKDNAMLCMHGFGANHHHWDRYIGPGKPLDTDKYFIITSDTFGNTQIGFEHSTSPTNSGFKMDFPAFNMRDTVNAEYKLIKEGLGIDHLLAVTGISMGASKALQFAISYPDFMDGIILTVGGAIWTTEIMYYMTELQSIIEACAGWNEGNYEANPRDCAAAALRSFVPAFWSRAWWNENITTPEAFQQWKQLWDKWYFGLQDARDLYLLSQASARSDIATTPGFNGDLMAVLKSVKAKALFITSPYDRWYLPEHIEVQHKAIPDSRIVSINSNAGHLLTAGDPNARWAAGEAIRGFLRELEAK